MTDYLEMIGLTIAIGAFVLAVATLLLWMLL